ncbi:MAG: glycosyltransferase [Thiogranum sp.]|nr:glycosyltransferase [Thiogranum sp.]
MNTRPMNIVLLGLSITSSWGNGHATTYRALTRALARRGHRLLFLERDVPWYAGQRDLANPDYCPTLLYDSLDELETAHRNRVAEADLVIVGSYVPEGAAVGEWVCDTAGGVTAFYDIDTSITVQGLANGSCEYLTPELIRRYHLLLSFAGGPLLQYLEEDFGAAMARPLYCSVDSDMYYPAATTPASDSEFDLGYMGTYSSDRQPKLDRLLIRAAREWQDGSFIVAGPMYPDTISWPVNTARHEHVAPDAHRDFYNAQRYTLNPTRADMVAVGWSPSVRLFEAAACGTPVISDYWEGLESFFKAGVEILIAEDTEAVLKVLHEIPEAGRRRIGAAARERVLGRHTAAHRALELEQYFLECLRRNARRSIRSVS